MIEDTMAIDQTLPIRFSGEDLSPNILFVDTYIKLLNLSRFFDLKEYKFYGYLRGRVTALNGTIRGLRSDFRVTVIKIPNGNMEDVIVSLKRVIQKPLNIILFASTATPSEVPQLPASESYSYLHRILKEQLEQSYGSVQLNGSYPPLLSNMHTGVCYVYKQHPGLLEHQKEIGRLCLSALSAHYYMNQGIK